ncbi:MAG: hypothetical protein HYX54_05210 [Chloroflexi bacterium]|nr:hypothetical protein [Chloroflexota bacterium]
MNTTVFRRSFLIVGLASLIVVIGVLLAQAVRQPETTTQTDAAALRFWRAVRVEAVEAFRYDSLEEIIGASDVVVLGAIEGVKLGREVRDLAAEETGVSRDIASTYFAEADIRVDRILRGRLSPEDGGRIRLDLLLPAPQVAPEIQALVPQPRAVFFLRDMDRFYGRAELVGLYQLTSLQGVLRDAGGFVATPEARTERFLAELQGQPFDALLQRISAPVPAN